MRGSSSKWTAINGKYGKWPAEPIGGEVPEQETERAPSFSPQLLHELTQPGEPAERMPPLKDSRLTLIFVHLLLEPLVDRAITWVTPAQPPAQPDAGYNELGRLTGLAAVTAQKYRQQIEQEPVS
jgi:hypothetical protein